MKPQVNEPNQPLRPVGAAHGGTRVVPAFQASGDFSERFTWASARAARSSPGYNMPGLRPCPAREAVPVPAAGDVVVRFGFGTARVDET